MKKKIVAYILCMAMGVSLLPMPVTQAADQGAVVYEEPTTDPVTDTDISEKLEMPEIKLDGLEVGSKFPNAVLSNLEDKATITTTWKHGKEEVKETDTVKDYTNYTVTIVVTVLEDKIFADTKATLKIGKKDSAEKIEGELSETRQELTLKYTFDQGEDVYKQALNSLNTAIEEAKKIKNKDNAYYTEKTWDVFQNTLKNAEKTYENESATKEEIESATNELKKTEDGLKHEHTYEAKWDWADDYTKATVTLSCKYNEDCGGMPIELTVFNPSETITKDPDCTNSGTKTYTATVEFNGKTYENTTDEVEIDSLGHDYKPTDYVWEYTVDGENWEKFPESEELDKSTAEKIEQVRCTQISTCNRDQFQVQTEVKATKTEEVSATCTRSGSYTYEATFGDNTVSKKKTINIKPGHTTNMEYRWEYKTNGKDWIPISDDTKWDAKEIDNVEVRYIPVEICEKNDYEDKKEKEAVTGSKLEQESKEPKCSEDGYYTYKVTITDEQGNLTEVTKEVVIKATGHNFENIEAVSATCEKDGNDAYYTCKTCKKYFSDKDGKKEIEENSWVVKATGHQIVEEVKKQPTKKVEGQLVRHCKNCDYVKETLALPKKEITIYVGAKAKEVPNIASTYNTSDYRIAYAKAKNAKKYEKYFNLKNANKNGNLKVTIKANSKKLLQVKLETVPLKVTVAGKEYKTNVKVKIKAPKIKITTKKIEFGGTRGTRYYFYYNIKGATKIKVRAKKLAFRNKEFDRYISTPKSNEKYTYFNIKESDLKNLGNKISFEIVAYYGKNISEKYIKTVSVK